MVKVTNGQLEGTLLALADIADNRMQGTKAWDVSEVKEPFAKLHGTFTETRQSMVKAHMEPGKERIEPDENPEFWKAFNELLNKEHKVTVTPLDASFVKSLDAVKPDSIGLLKHLGIIVSKNGKPGAKA